MNELLEFLTSREIIVVYCIVLIVCFLRFVLYIFEKNNDSFRKKHNTRELNKLVERIKEEVVPSKEIENYTEEPILQTISEDSALNEMIDNTKELEPVEEIAPVDSKVEEEKEEVTLEPIIIEPEEIVEDTAKIKYTSIEPDIETAQLELKKITEELRKQEEIEKTGELSLSNYEEQQEESAIISLEELVKRGKSIYEANELSQYADEGNEPISIKELQEKSTLLKNYDEPFIIENMVSKEELEEVDKEVLKQQPKVKLDDFNTINVESYGVEKKTGFKNSPIISPVYGIEQRPVSTNDLELENTANYEKLDQEIKRTNEFLMTLRELQDKLD